MRAIELDVDIDDAGRFQGQIPDGCDQRRARVIVLLDDTASAAVTAGDAGFSAVAIDTIGFRFDRRGYDR